MRPEILFPLFAPLRSLNGIGPKLAVLFSRLTGPRVLDVLWHLPSDVIDRRYRPLIADAEVGRIVTLRVQVEAARPQRDRRQPIKIPVYDESGTLDLVFFHAKADYLTRQLPEGSVRLISGTLQSYQDRLQITHPDIITSEDEAGGIPPVEPVYPLTQGINRQTMLKAIAQALKVVPQLPEWQDPAWRQKQEWPGWREALVSLHKPDDESILAPIHVARQRLAYDEFLAGQLALLLIRRHMQAGKGVIRQGTGQLLSRFRKALPFELTADQQKAAQEISEDLTAPSRMLRLLQGDVGSGKTVVAFMAALHVVESGAQAAVMAPTAVLARQHYRTLAPWAEALGLRITLLTGKEKAAIRKDIVAGMETGDLPIVVGTHALFQSSVAFHNLGLAIVDEQHRFGVHQRLALTEKGTATDILVMSATPIPRTYTLTVYGDMAVSALRDPPIGRQPVTTAVMPMSKISAVTEALNRVLAAGEQAYWVCPQIDESDAAPFAAAEARYQELHARFGDAVGLLHGRLPQDGRDAVMDRFVMGQCKILVATTVIEVGVDVANATTMVIENAERFGLAQLHQLRGRVGRGSKKSHCLLLWGEGTGAMARKRLAALREVNDGFIIAEMDAQLRGSGDVLGTRQSGLPQFRLADLQHHKDLLLAARDDAKIVMETDPALRSERGDALRVLLYLFEKDAVLNTIRSG